MVETLEHLLRRAARDPRASRAPLYKELLRSHTYLLTVDAPMKKNEVRRTTSADASFPIWADKDLELGGVWVPVFPARDRVRDFIAARGLRAPKSKEFLWMGHLPGQVFRLMRGVQRFAGLRLFLEPDCSVDISWPEVRDLSEGNLPKDTPSRHELPLDRLVIPAGARLSFGKLHAWTGEAKPLLLSMPAAGKFRPEDLRRMVKLPLDNGRHAWTPVRHFFQILRHLKLLNSAGTDRYVDHLLTSLLSFEMYGESEALCEWLAARGFEEYAWLGLSAVYGRSGRLEECATLCNRAVARYPAEKTFHINGLRALVSLGRKDEAARFSDNAMKLFPEDELLAQLRRDLFSPTRR